MISAIKLERSSSGHWDVRTLGKYPLRVGHIAGGHGSYVAELGPETLGYFPTVRAASEAIAKHVSDSMPLDRYR